MEITAKNYPSVSYNVALTTNDIEDHRAS